MRDTADRIWSRKAGYGARGNRTQTPIATLGYSRRHHVRAFRSERQESWFDGLESAFVKFGGVPEEVLFDNARALVVEHDPRKSTDIYVLS